MQNYEDQQNGVAPRTHARKKGGDPNDDGNVSDTVVGSHGTEFEARRLLGIIWDRSDFESDVKRPMKKGEVKKFVFGTDVVEIVQ